MKLNAATFDRIPPPPRLPSDSSLAGETHWDVPEGSGEHMPDFIIPQQGLKTHSLGHGRTKMAVPLHQGDKLGMAAQANDLVKVQKLLKKGIDVNVKNPHSLITPLGVASERGYEEMVRVLLKAKANVDDVTKDGLTPLHISCQFGKHEVARLLSRR